MEYNLSQCYNREIINYRFKYETKLFIIHDFIMDRIGFFTAHKSFNKNADNTDIIDITQSINQILQDDIDIEKIQEALEYIIKSIYQIKINIDNLDEKVLIYILKISDYLVVNFNSLASLFVNYEKWSKCFSIVTCDNKIENADIYYNELKEKYMKSEHDLKFINFIDLLTFLLHNLEYSFDPSFKYAFISRQTSNFLELNITIQERIMLLTFKSMLDNNIKRLINSKQGYFWVGK